jgi:hypothetical protein
MSNIILEKMSQGNGKPAGNCFFALSQSYMIVLDVGILKDF